VVELGIGLDIEEPSPTEITQAIGTLREIIEEHPADVGIKDEWGRTPLHLTHCGEIARFLLDNGAPLEDRDPEGRTPLHTSALNGELHVAEVLLQHGSNIWARDNEDHLPIDLARKLEHREIWFGRAAGRPEEVEEWLRYRKQQRQKIIDLLKSHESQPSK